MALQQNALTTVQNYKTYYTLDTSDTSQDATYEMLINQISDEIETRCQRKFGKANYTQQCNGNGSRNLQVSQYPILDASVQKEDVDVTDFTILADEGELSRKEKWRHGDVYTISYTAGYVLPQNETDSEIRTLPSDLERACIVLVHIALEMRDSEHLKTETLGPLKSEYLPDIPVFIQSILDRYTREDL